MPNSSITHPRSCCLEAGAFERVKGWFQSLLSNGVLFFGKDLSLQSSVLSHPPEIIILPLPLVLRVRVGQSWNGNRLSDIYSSLLWFVREAVFPSTILRRTRNRSRPSTLTLQTGAFELLLEPSIDGQKLLRIV